MTLTYHVTAGPRTQIVVMGLDVDSQLRACLEEAWAESVFDDFLVEEVTEIVKGVLASRGYLQPVVDARITEEDSEVGRVPRSGPAAVLTIAIEPGARTGSTTVRIEGADEGLTRQLETWLGASDLIESAATDPGRLEREITAYLRSNGHLQARVTAGAPLFEGASAVVTVKAAAGPVFTMASIAFEGTEALAIDAVSDAVGLAEGDPYDPAVADAARDRLVALYRRQAYPSPAVTVRPSVRTDARAVDLTFAIDAGVRQTLGEVVVSGNRAIDSDVIVRALELPLNEPLRAEPLLQARRRVFDTGLFRRVDLESEPIGPPAQGGRETPMRVRVAVEEWPALRLRYGLQIAEERPEGEIKGRDLVPGLSADLTRRTLFGRAIAVGGALELQRRERQARGFINAPMLLGWPIESSLSLNRTWRTVGTTDRADDRIGVSWEQRLRFVSNLQLSYGYRFERSRTDVPSDPIIGPLPPIVLNIARVSSAASWDTRDDPSETTRGSLVSYSLEFAPETAGSDIRFIRHVAQAYNFRPWRDLVFASAARVGMVRPLGGQDLILSERFFSGGAGTVRGVAEDRLGQRDFFGDPLGGEALLVLNQEVRLPIYRWLRGVGFIDAGNVFATPGDIGLRRLVGSVGFGLRLATPFALLRADYAKPVWAGSLEGSGRWNFGIGHAF
jgi:outer membrane protein assembly factor BamA